MSVWKCYSFGNLRNFSFYRFYQELIITGFPENYARCAFEGWGGSLELLFGSFGLWYQTITNSICLRLFALEANRLYLGWWLNREAFSSLYSAELITEFLYFKGSLLLLIFFEMANWFSKLSSDQFIFLSVLLYLGS